MINKRSHICTENIAYERWKLQVNAEVKNWSCYLRTPLMTSHIAEKRSHTSWALFLYHFGAIQRRNLRAHGLLVKKWAPDLANFQTALRLRTVDMSVRSGSIWITIVLVWLFIALSAQGAAALSSQEIDALKNILETFPQLLEIPWRAAKSRSTYIGKAWTYDTVDTACSGGEGWNLFGIRCTRNGNVDTILLYVSRFVNALYHIF